MQYNINMFLAFVITGSLLIISCAKHWQEKRLSKELLECIVCKDEVLLEFKKIRHEYNNMMQTLTCLIEEEDLGGLKEYNSKLLEKTYLLNKNNLTQLVRIKDKNILTTVYKLFIEAKESGVTLNLTIYNDIAEISSYKTEGYNVLKDYLNYAYTAAVKEAMEINLKISANDMGLLFHFENCASIKVEHLALKSIKPKKNPKIGKDIFFNTFIQDNHLIQEIIISFNTNSIK